MFIDGRSGPLAVTASGVLRGMSKSKQKGSASLKHEGVSTQILTYTLIKYLQALNET